MSPEKETIQPLWAACSSTVTLNREVFPVIIIMYVHILALFHITYHIFTLLRECLFMQEQITLYYTVILQQSSSILNLSTLALSFIFCLWQNSP